jgi:hypothetical protein
MNLTTDASRPIWDKGSDTQADRKPLDLFRYELIVFYIKSPLFLFSFFDSYAGS